MSMISKLDIFEHNIKNFLMSIADKILLKNAP